MSLERERDEARRALEAERAASAVERDALLGERDALLVERDALRGERGTLQRQLAGARKDAANRAEARASLREVLEARGCIDDREMVIVLRGLLDSHPRELLDAIALAERQPLAAVLDERVAVVAEGVELADCDRGVGSDSVILHVPPDRCEISGGSDIQVEFRRFLDACRKASWRRVTIVGGSPAYRRQLRSLAEPYQKELQLTLVPGNRRRERRRAESDVRSSDLVVIWGATELDHSVSAVYTQGQNPVLRVPHRGISIMLRRVAESITKSR